MSLDRVVLIDTETDGTGPEAVAVEVACVVYDVPRASPVLSFASLIRASSNAAANVNGIPPELLVDAPEAEEVWSRVARVTRGAQALVAHNTDFDRRFVPASVAGEIPWICTMEDVAWPRSADSRKLVDIALAHGIGVSHAHRALTDCDLIARLFTRLVELGVDLQAFLARGLRPKARFAVDDRGLRFDEARNNLAREHGFRFDRPTKTWLRTLAIEDAPALPFSVRQVA